MFERRYNAYCSREEDHASPFNGKKPLVLAILIAIVGFVPRLFGSIVRHTFFWLGGIPTRANRGDFARQSKITTWGIGKNLMLFPFRLVLLPLFLLWLPISQALGLQYVPRQRRAWGNILWGAPALFLGMTAIATAFLIHVRTPSLSSDYRNAVIDADSQQNLNAMEIYLQRLIRLDTDDKEMQYNYACILEDRGEVGRAVAIMSSLAPEDRVGYPPAHLWLAKWLLADPDMTDFDRLNCRHHLEVAEAEFPDAVEVHEQLASLHLFLINFEGRDPHLEIALRHLESAAEQQPALYYRLARVQQQFEDHAGAARSFALAEQHFRLSLEDNPSNHDARTNLAGSLLGMSRFEEARSVLLEGLEIDATHPFNILLAETIVAMFEQKRQAGLTPDATLFAMLIEAMRYNPQSTSAALRLLNYGVKANDPESRDTAIQQLESFVTVGEGVAMAHLLLGIHYFNNEGDSTTSMFHLEAAYRLDPSLSDSANNFAWLLAHQEEPDYDRALAIIDSVLVEHPDNASYLDTRGHILLRQGRWEDVLRDLERALPGLRERPGTHEALAEIYDHYGQSTLAAQHRSIAERLRSVAGR